MPKGLGHVSNADIGVSWINASISQIYVKREGTGLTFSHVINADIGVTKLVKTWLMLQHGGGVGKLVIRDRVGQTGQ